MRNADEHDNNCFIISNQKIEDTKESDMQQIEEKEQVSALRTLKLQLYLRI